MTRIPFVEARFYDPDETQRAIDDRLAAHLCKLRVVDLSAVIPDSDEDGEHAFCLPLP